MSPAHRRLSILLTLWVILAPSLLTGCNSISSDKRILQYMIRQGLGKRYPGNAQEENYLTIGDGFQYADTFNPEVRGTARVAVDGTINLPEAGAVHVAGMTRTELETYLTQKLSPYYAETDVRVQIVTGPGKVYYVVGAVGRPGPRPFRGGINIMDAVFLAGPRPHSANLSRVKLIRADPMNPLILRADVAAIWKYGDSSTNYEIQEYDIVYVPPTIMQRLADIVSGLIVPVTSVLRSFFQVLFFFEYGQDAFLLNRGNQNRWF